MSIDSIVSRFSGRFVGRVGIVGCSERSESMNWRVGREGITGIDVDSSNMSGRATVNRAFEIRTCLVTLNERELDVGGFEGFQLRWKTFLLTSSSALREWVVVKPMYPLPL